MVGIELVKNKSTEEAYPWKNRIGIRICEHLCTRGILLRPLGNVIVLMPPLAVSADEIRFLCREIYMAIEKMTNQYGIVKNN